jgi:hypothetical protein
MPRDQSGIGVREGGRCRLLGFGRIRREVIERLKGESLLRMTLVECWRLSHSRFELEAQDMIHENK